MPYETRFVDGGKGIQKFGRGVVTSAELLSSSVQRTIEESKKIEHVIKHGLVDFTEATELQATSETVKKLVEIDRGLAQYSQGCFVAVVAPDTLVFGLARLWAGYVGDIGWVGEVFRDRESAKAWLRTKLGGGDPESCPLEEYPSLRPGVET